MAIQIVIPIKPEGLKRHRSRYIQPKDKTKEGFIRNYHDTKQRNLMNRVSDHLRNTLRGCPAYPTLHPVMLGVIAFFPIPVSKSLKWKQDAAAGKIRHVTKPDLSNITKLVEDAGIGILYKDDAQICEYLRCGKFYSWNPKIVVTMEILQPEQKPIDQTKQLVLF